MNAEARGIVLLMVNTGLRHSEAANLTGNTIRLDVEVPHVEVAPEGRQVKSSNAKRTIPLLGVSLDAMRAHPEGFPRYRASPATLSATVNAYLRENKMLESEGGHTIYGLRHGFEDRMLAAGIDERVRRDVMGHALGPPAVWRGGQPRPDGGVAGPRGYLGQHGRDLGVAAQPGVPGACLGAGQGGLILLPLARGRRSGARSIRS